MFGLLFAFLPLLRYVGICGKNWTGNWDLGKTSGLGNGIRPPPPFQGPLGKIIPSAEK